MLITTKIIGTLAYILCLTILVMIPVQIIKSLKKKSKRQLLEEQNELLKKQIEILQNQGRE